MTRFWYRFTLAIGIAIGAAAFAADVAPYSSTQDLTTLNDFSLGDGVYRVSKTFSRDQSSSTGYNAIEIKEGKTTVIYIPHGITLTVVGAPARRPDQCLDTTADDGRKRVGLAYTNWPGDWGGAGIFVPTNSTLIVTGEGTLIAKGGNGADGMQGFQGWDQPWVGSSKARTGGGGQGGYGGGGAGAAIGGRGGKGGKWGEMWDTNNAEYPDKNNFENFTGENNNRDGNPAEDGQNGFSMGKVYILGSVKVEATGGLPGKKGGAAGPHTDWHKKDCLYEGKDDWIAGPGGGGGGGGAGCGVQFAIGGGAGGGGGGGGGATGSFVVSDDWDDSDYQYGDFWHLVVGGEGGNGGKGPANVSGANGATGERSPDSVKSVVKKSGDYGHDVNCKKGGAGGNAGESGKNGQLFLGSGVEVKSMNNISAFPSATSVSYTAEETGFDCIRYPITMVLNGEESRTFKQTLGCSLPETVTIPSRSGYEFLGFYTERNGAGEMYYNADGELQIEGAWSKCQGLTLYASWAIIGQGDTKTIVINEGVELEFDGLVDAIDGKLVQPATGNLFDVKPGGKLVLKNLTVLGSALGRDSVIKNFGEVFVTNCVFQDNFSPYGAGAVYRDKPGAKAVFYGCAFKGNSALEGGVISAEGSTVSVIYSSFFDNFTTLQSFEKLKATDAETKGNHEGAAILGIDDAKINLISCTFYNNYCWNDEWPYAGAVSLSNTAATPIVCKNNLIAGYATLNYGFIRGENYSTKDSDDNNLCKKDSTDILADEIRREVNNVNHYARRPLPAARTGGDSGNLYTNDDYSKFAKSNTSETPNFIAGDQFGQHPIDGWYGAITGNTLQYLINNTNVGETLIVPSGRYDPVELDKKITIIGEDRDSTYINGDMLEPCLTIMAGGQEASISDFSFIYGNGENGGGITAPETCGGYITNCVFRQCHAMNGGAAAYLKTASQCTFTNCIANATGGGTYGCELVDRSRYLGCIAREEAGGGASEDKVIRASFLSKNLAPKGGGGNKTKFFNCTFDQNEATAAEDSQAAIFASRLTGCVFYGNRLPTETSQDGTSFENLRATAEYKSDMFYNAPEGDFHLRLRNYDEHSNTRTPVDHSSINVGKLDPNTLNDAYNNHWLDIDGSPLVSEHMLTGEKFLYGGCYAFAPFKISGTIVTGEEEWYDNTNAKTSLREAIDAALSDPAYMTNEVATITFSEDLKPKDREDYVILTFDESQIDVAAFTNRTLVIQGPTNKVIAINGNQKYRAFRVLPHNNLKVENILFQNCLGSEYGTNPQASSHGGAILNYGNLSVSNCVFAANTTGTRKDYNNQDYPVGYGGAIATMSSGTNTAQTVIRNSSFYANKAQRGGALYGDKSTKTDVFFSTFGENKAIGSGSTEAAGGAIATDMSTVYYNNTTNAQMMIVNSTLVGNSVPQKEGAGGAIASGRGLVLLDSIVLGNTTGNITNDIAIAGGTIGKPAKPEIISTAYGNRTVDSNMLDYIDDMSYQVSDLEQFIATTNAVNTETVLPHIIYPRSRSTTANALEILYVDDNTFGYDALSFKNVVTKQVWDIHEEEYVDVVVTNYVSTTMPMRGNLTDVVLFGETFVKDQTGEEIQTPIFGATAKVQDARINERTSSDDENQETPADPTEEEDPFKNSVVFIVDYLGVTNGYDTVEAAINAFKYQDNPFRPGDTIIVRDPTDKDSINAIASTIIRPMRDFYQKHEWYDFAYSEDMTTFALALNEKAKPIITAAPEINYSPTEVAMRTVENMKPGLWYALGRADSIEGPYVATNWQEGKGPNSFGQMYFDKPLTAPKTGDGGFYRVIVAPYCPSGEVIR